MSLSICKITHKRDGGIKPINKINGCPLLLMWIHVGTKPATRGGWIGADQNFFRNLNRRPISRKSPKPTSVLTKVWNSYWKAKPTQKASNERVKPRSKFGSEFENCRTDLPGSVWPVYWTGLTGRVCSKSSRPVWPVLPTGLTGGTQKTPENLD